MDCLSPMTANAMSVLQLLKLTSVPDAVAAAGAAQSSSAPSAQHRQHLSRHHPAKRKREPDGDDDSQPAGSAPLADRGRGSAAGAAATEQDVESEPDAAKASRAADAPYSGVDTAELATVVPWASRRFVWDTLQLQLQVCCAELGLHPPAVNHPSTSSTSTRKTPSLTIP